MSAVSTCRMLHREAMKESYHVGIEILSTVFSPANLRILPPPPPPLLAFILFEVGLGWSQWFLCGH